MAISTDKSRQCQICNKKFTQKQVIRADQIREAVAELILESYPEWSDDGYICIHDLDLFRSHYVQSVLDRQYAELTDLEEEVISSIHTHDIVTRNVNASFAKKFTFGEWLSDKIASFGGSWTFIFLFFSMMMVWCFINAEAVMGDAPFDPYPYILLNLVLSCLAAIQAPIIMMSQNRQEAKDRMRSEYDYRVNLKAELEIRHLGAKVDLLLTHDWRRLLEIQQIEIDMLHELLKSKTRD